MPTRSEPYDGGGSSRSLLSRPPPASACWNSLSLARRPEPCSPITLKSSKPSPSPWAPPPPSSSLLRPGSPPPHSRDKHDLTLLLDILGLLTDPDTLTALLPLIPETGDTPVTTTPATETIDAPPPVSNAV